MSVYPKTYLVGCTTICEDGLHQYLKDTDQTEFVDDLGEAEDNGISEGESLVSMYAKLCYNSLTAKHNKNISKVRSIEDNLKGVFESAHGSVLEHMTLNFVTTGCSRIFTHELVRHRAGCAFSQTSGRYVRTDNIKIVSDPILEPVQKRIDKIVSFINKQYAKLVEETDLSYLASFSNKKKITSALRRILPNGQINEIGWSCNARALRHMIMMRTSRHAEWEIRYVFNEVYQIVKQKYPLLLYGAREERVDGLLEITGMKTQPYQEDGGK
jgi:thymidylate synthase (FAD)